MIKITITTKSWRLTMLNDNGYTFLPLLKNRGAFFASTVFQSRVYYIAGNRAARRAIKSNRFKKLGLLINLDDNTIS